MGGVVSISWLDWGLSAEGDLAPRPTGADRLPGHDAATTNSRRAQQKVGQADESRLARYAHCFAGGATGDGVSWGSRSTWR